MDDVALVTGGTRGIGLAISQALMDAGCKVVAAYRSDEAAAQAFRDAGGVAVKLDVSDFKACQKTVEEVEADVGPVSILVNNAGATKDGVLHKMSEEDWHFVLETNLTSCFSMCRAVVGGMRTRGYGRIVNIGSINGEKGQFGQTNYAAAKAGILGFTKALALETAAKGITVNAICPGYVETDMISSVKPEILDAIVKQIPVGRMGKPEEIASLVAFLVSENASFITGATLDANGGQYMA